MQGYAILHGGERNHCDQSHGRPQMTVMDTLEMILHSIYLNPQAYPLIDTERIRTIVDTRIIGISHPKRAKLEILIRYLGCLR